MTDLLTNQDVAEIKKRAKRGEILQALKILEEKNNGILTPYEVLDEAKDENSPLHTAFDWDNQRAGEKYRLMQARMLLSTVKVEYLGEKSDAYYNAKVEVGGQEVRGYFPVETVMSDEQVHKEVLRQAVRELEYAQKKYNYLKEMHGVINQDKLDEVKKDL